jgi:hypothetical protein
VAGEEPRTWRKHPLLKRLAVLGVIVLGISVWQRTGAPERELVLWLEGPGWSDIRVVEFQLKTANGELLKREEHFFQAVPPSSLTLKEELPSGRYEVWVFARGEGGLTRPHRVERLNLGDEDVRVDRQLRVPTSR